MKDPRPTIPTQDVVVLTFPCAIEMGPGPNQVTMRLVEQDGLPLPSVRVDDDTRTFGDGPDGQELYEAVERAATRAALEAFIRGRVFAEFRKVPRLY